MITLTIPEASPSLNEFNRKHWTCYHKMRQHWSMLVLIAKTEAHVSMAAPPDKVVVRILREGRRLLDHDNLWGGCKVIGDSLREQRLITDDDPDHMTLSVKQIQIPKSSYPRTRVEIEIA